MQHLTTTELRTKSSQLVTALKSGLSVTLIHRSNIVGKIIPNTTSMNRVKTINGKKLAERIEKLDFPRLSLKEMDRRYRIAMMKKHGKGLR